MDAFVFSGRELARVLFDYSVFKYAGGNAKLLRLDALRRRIP